MLRLNEKGRTWRALVRCLGGVSNAVPFSATGKYCTNENPTLTFTLIVKRCPTTVERLLLESSDMIKLENSMIATYVDIASNAR